MATTLTTLAADVAANDLTIKVTSATNFSAGRLVQFGDELALIDKVTGTVVDLRFRGLNGSVAKAHKALTPITVGDATDFPARSEKREVAFPREGKNVVTYGADATIAVPSRDALILLRKATAGAYTLPAPSALQDGLTLIINADTAAAHVVTATTLIEDGVTGGAKTTATFAAFVGASMTLVAVRGKWHTVSLKAVTIT
jgi:hypothetical protein